MSNLRQIRERRGLTQKDLADALGTTDVSISRYEKEDNRLTLPLLQKMANVLECTVSDIVADPKPSGPADQIDVPEYDVRVSAGGGFYIDEETQKDTWPFSRQYLTQELRLSTKGLVIIEIQGDSMEPVLSTADRVLVDTNDRNPAQPGIFVLWDSERTVVKRIEKIPGRSPITLLLISDNPIHNNYEVPAEETNIIGRVVWYARRM